MTAFPIPAILPVTKIRTTMATGNIIERLQEIAPAPSALQAMQDEAKRKGTDKLTLREINAEVSAVRQQAPPYRIASS